MRSPTQSFLAGFSFFCVVLPDGATSIVPTTKDQECRRQKDDPLIRKRGVVRAPGESHA